MVLPIAAVVFRLTAAASVVVLAGLVAASPAAAENPSELQADLADDGVYIAPARAGDIDGGTVLPVVERARTEGLSMYVLWPNDPQPNTDAFARRIQEQYQVDVVLVFGPEGQLGSFVSEDYEAESIRAVAAARDTDDPAATADAYLTGLLEEPDRERPAIVNRLVRWIAIMVGALVAAAVGEQMIRQYKRSRQRRQLEELRTD